MKEQTWINAQHLASFAHGKLEGIDTYRARNNVVRLYVALCIRYFRFGLSDSDDKIKTAKTRWAIRKDCESLKASDTYKGNVGGRNFYDRLNTMKQVGLVNQFEEGEPITFVIPEDAVTTKNAAEIAEIKKAAGKKKIVKLDQKLARLRQNEAKNNKTTSPIPALA